MRVLRESAVRMEIQQERHDEHFHLPHQGLWFILLLAAMLLLLSKNVTGGDRPASIVSASSNTTVC